MIKEAIHAKPKNCPYYSKEVTVTRASVLSSDVHMFAEALEMKAGHFVVTVPTSHTAEPKLRHTHLLNMV